MKNQPLRHLRVSENKILGHSCALHYAQYHWEAKCTPAPSIQAQLGKLAEDGNIEQSFGSGELGKKKTPVSTMGAGMSTVCLEFCNKNELAWFDQCFEGSICPTQLDTCRSYVAQKPCNQLHVNCLFVLYKLSSIAHRRALKPLFAQAP